MLVSAQTLGGYPRSRLVRRTLRMLEQGEVSVWHARDVVRLASAAVIGAQVSSGLAIVSDGMLDWHDIFRPFVEAWRNVTPTGLLRYFDNNFFYRIPLFTSEPEPSDPVLAPRVREFVQLVAPATLKVVVPGPVTFTLMSKNASGISSEELAEAIARLLALEVKSAVEAGAGFVQIDEPILSDPDAKRDDAILAAELADRIASEAGAPSALSVYFYSVKPSIYDALLDAKVDYIFIDIVDGGGASADVIASKGVGGKKLGLGAVEARNIYSEPFERIAGRVERALKGLKGEIEELVITTSTWLDLIPYKYSLKKTRLLGVYAEKLAEKLGATYLPPGGEW